VVIGVIGQLDDGVGVTLGVIEGEIPNVGITLGVKVGVTDGVIEGDAPIVGVTLGVSEGVILVVVDGDTDGVTDIDGVIVGVLVGVGVIDGVIVGVGDGDDAGTFVITYSTDVVQEPVLCIVPPVIGVQNVTVYPDNICDVVIPVAIKTIVPPDVVPEMLYGPACVKKYIGCNVNVYSVHPVLGVGDGVIVTLGVTVGYVLGLMLMLELG